MGGGLMQLVAYGAQDVYLTGNPQITFFKVVYRRHTNFSMEAIEQTINGSSTLGASPTNGSVTISRNGDLVHKVYVTSSAAGITNGSALVNSVDLEIGGQLIDRQTAEWMQIVTELNTPESKAAAVKAMQGDFGSSGTTGVGMVQVPLQFYFCRNPGLALPLIALQYHEVKLKFTWGASESVVGVANVAVKVMCDYIYLDTDERRRFAQVSHEYLIEQVQVQSANASTKSKLNFNHPVKELIWTNNSRTSYGTAKLTLNGHDRFSAQEEEYFQLRQPVDCHTAVPAQNLPVAARGAVHNVPTFIAEEQSGSNGNFDADINVLGLFQALKDANTKSGGEGAGQRKFVQLAKASADLVLVGQRHLVKFVRGATVMNTMCTVASVGGAGTGGARSIGYDVDVHNGEATLVGDRLNILAFKIVTGCRTSQLIQKINCYSFALKPEEHQPSGTCNFSRIDTAHLETKDALFSSNNIYAVNYNVLRIMSGMGGLAYSN
jgi:hypothetical protein